MLVSGAAADLENQNCLAAFQRGPHALGWDGCKLTNTMCVGVAFTRSSIGRLFPRLYVGLDDPNAIRFEHDRARHASRVSADVPLPKMERAAVIDHGMPMKEQIEKLKLPPVSLVASLTYTDQHYKAIAEFIAPQGKFGLIDDPSEFNVAVFKGKAVSVHWELMFTRSSFQTPDMIAQHHFLNEPTSSTRVCSAPRSTRLLGRSTPRT